MKIEVGKTYLTRDGRRVTIEAETEKGGYWRMRGKYEENGSFTYRSRAGRFTNYASPPDLVREAE